MSEDQEIEGRPKNWLIPAALVVLRDENSHGYTLMGRLEELGFEQMNPGTVYRTLRQMENEGLCESEWETSNGGGPACRVYSITESGEARLDSWAQACERYQRVLEAFSLAYSARRGSPPRASSSETNEAS